MNAKLARQKATTASKNLIVSRIRSGLKAIEKAYKLNREEVERSYSSVKYQIDEAAKLGNFSITVEVSTLNIAKIITKKLKLLGFKAREYHDTIETGVDEWEDRYCVAVNW